MSIFNLRFRLAPRLGGIFRFGPLLLPNYVECVIIALPVFIPRQERRDDYDCHTVSTVGRGECSCILHKQVVGRQERPVTAHGLVSR